MTTITTTSTSHTVRHYTATINGVEYETTLEASEFIEPKVTVEEDRTTVIYASRDDYPMNPRDDYSAGVMVVTDEPRLGDYTVDTEDDNEIAALRELIDSGLVPKNRYSETDEDLGVYYAVKCNHAWPAEDHGLVDGIPQNCDSTYEVLIFGTDGCTFEDGSTWGVEFPLGGYGDLESDEGTLALLAAALEANRWTSTVDLMKVYVEHGRPDIHAFMEFSLSGYTQSDWANGYAYLTEDGFTDPEAALLAEVEEYGAFFAGDSYGIARETYVDGERDEFDCVFGFHGDDAALNAIENGDHF